MGNIWIILGIIFAAAGAAVLTAGNILLRQQFKQSLNRR